MNQEIPTIPIQRPPAKIQTISFAYDRTQPSGYLSVTGLNFKPDGAIVFCANNLKTHGSVAIINGNYQTICFFRASGGGFSMWNQDYTCLVCQSGGSSYEYANIVSFDDNGLTLNFTKLGTPTGTLLVIVQASKKAV